MRAYPREYNAVGLEFSNVAVVGEEVFGGGEQVEAILAHVWIVAVDEDGFEEGVGGCAQGFEAGECGLVVFCIESGLIGVFGVQDCAVESIFRIIFEECGVDVAGVGVCLADDVCDAFEGGDEAGEDGAGAVFCERFDASDDGGDVGHVGDGEDGVDDFDGVCVAEHEAQSRFDEVEDLLAECVVVGGDGFCAERSFGESAAVDGGADDRSEVHGLFVFAERAEDAVGAASESEGVGGASGDSPEREQSGNRVEFIGDADDGASERLCDGCASLTWAVGFADALADVFWESVETAVVVAHDAFDFGKFVHHVCRQIGFAEVGGLSNIVEIDIGVSPEFCDGDGESFVAHDFIEGGSHAFDVAHVGEFFVVEFEVVFSVFVEEEFSVFESCDEDAFVSACDDFSVVDIGIGESDEVWHEFLVVVDDAEVALIGDHARDDDFVREFQEGGVEGADDADGPFEDLDDFFEEFVVFDEVSADGGGGGVSLFEDFSASFVGIDENFSASQFIDVFVGCSDFDGFGCHESMAVGESARGDACELHGQDFAAEDAQDPVDGASEERGFVGPSHGFCPVNGGEAFFEDVAEEF